ncbi:MAG TPA: hypothetical protein VFA34_14685 [Actinomycetota bacterium]|nr:hypothetical protein [Actinomycetota bacterium]
MDPFERQFGFRRRINVEAIIAFVIGVLAAYVIQVSVGFGGGNLFTVLIVVAVGGLWYHIRRVL